MAKLDTRIRRRLCGYPTEAIEGMGLMAVGLCTVLKLITCRYR